MVKLNKSIRRLVLPLAAAGVLAGATASQAADTIKIGILHSLSGTMAISEGPALIIIPICVISMIIVACRIATNVTRRSGVVTHARRSGPGGRPRRYLAWPGKHASPSEHFQELKRLG